MHKELLAIVSALLLMLALIPACTKDKGGEYTKTKGTIEKGADETGEYLAKDRAAFEKDAEEKLSALENRLTEMRAEAASRGEKFAREHKEQIDTLQKMVHDARARLDELENSSEKAWAHLREGFDKAYTEMESAFEKAGEEFKK